MSATLQHSQAGWVNLGDTAGSFDHPAELCVAFCFVREIGAQRRRAVRDEQAVVDPFGDQRINLLLAILAGPVF